MRYFLGIDDTDVLGRRPGTGRLARELAAALESQNLARMVGVIRHQLLVDPRIPYTSHNSPACVILDGATAASGLRQRVFEAATAYVAAVCAPGSDPGVCLAEAGCVDGDVVGFGHRASFEVVTKAEAVALAEQFGLSLAELAGTGDGVIGALAAVGLTAEGNGGRFLEIAGGLRDLGARAPAQVLRQRGITLLSMSRNGEVVPSDASILTGDWVRPRLVAGRPVLFVEPGPDGWRCFDRKTPHADVQQDEQ